MNAEVKSEMDRVFGSILKQYRNRLSYTQADMAEKLGISEKYVLVRYNILFKQAVLNFWSRSFSEMLHCSKIKLKFKHLEHRN